MSKCGNKKKAIEVMFAEIVSKIDVLQGDINNIKQTIYNENANLGNIIAEQTLALKSTFTTIFQTPEYTNLFPIKTLQALHEWENTINDDNKPAMIKCVKTLLGSPGIRKNLRLILCQELMLEVNLEGIHNKTRLNNFVKVMDVLFSASIGQDKPHDFHKDMRWALSAAKNRYHKDECIRKKKAILNPTSTNVENENFN